MKIAYDLLLMAVLARVYQHCLPTADYQSAVALPDVDIIDLKSVCRRGSGGGGDGFARADHIGQHACFGQRRNNGDDNYQRQQKIFPLALASHHLAEGFARSLDILIGGSERCRILLHRFTLFQRYFFLP